MMNSLQVWYDEQDIESREPDEVHEGKTFCSAIKDLFDFHDSEHMEPAALVVLFEALHDMCEEDINGEPIGRGFEMGIGSVTVKWEE
jgi:hypothetical protein